MLLILDLDDTIFATQSMGPEIFAPVFQLLKDYFERTKNQEVAAAVLEDLWQMPFDSIVKKYSVPRKLQDQVLEKLEMLDYDLKIQTFSDYPALVKIPVPKVLVTTGFSNLQEAKIDALNIRNHFEEIHIDDPFQKDRKHKRGIFQELISARKLSVASIWAIGDNPNSEIIAAKELGVRTIQRLQSKNQLSSPLADYSIHSFLELSGILGT